MAYRIYDEFEVDEINQDDNGDFIISATMPIDEWLIGYLLSFGSKVCIIEPKYLKKIVYNEAKKICEQNKPWHMLSRLLWYNTDEKVLKGWTIYEWNIYELNAE